MHKYLSYLEVNDILSSRNGGSLHIKSDFLLALGNYAIQFILDGLIASVNQASFTSSDGLLVIVLLSNKFNLALGLSYVTSSELRVKSDRLRRVF